MSVRPSSSGMATKQRKKATQPKEKAGKAVVPNKRHAKKAPSPPAKRGATKRATGKPKPRAGAKAKGPTKVAPRATPKVVGSRKRRTGTAGGSAATGPRPPFQRKRLKKADHAKAVAKADAVLQAEKDRERELKERAKEKIRKAAARKKERARELLRKAREAVRLEKERERAAARAEVQARRDEAQRTKQAAADKRKKAREEATRTKQLVADERRRVRDEQTRARSEEKRAREEARLNAVLSRQRAKQAALAEKEERRKILLHERAEKQAARETARAEAVRARERALKERAEARAVEKETRERHRAEAREASRVAQEEARAAEQRAREAAQVEKAKLRDLSRAIEGALKAERKKWGGSIFELVQALFDVLDSRPEFEVRRARADGLPLEDLLPHAGRLPYPVLAWLHQTSEFDAVWSQSGAGEATGRVSVPPIDSLDLEGFLEPDGSWDAAWERRLSRLFVRESLTLDPAWARASAPRHSAHDDLCAAIVSVGVSEPIARGLIGALGRRAWLIVPASQTEEGRRRLLVEPTRYSVPLEAGEVDLPYLDRLNAGAPVSKASIAMALQGHADFLASGGGKGKFTMANEGGLPVSRYTLREGQAPLDTDLQADFSRENLTALKFMSSLLEDAHFTGTRAPGANFSKGRLARSVFCHGTFEDANFQGADLTGCDFTRARLAGCDFRHANLTDTNFERADLSGANFAGAVTSGTKFGGALVRGIKY